MNLSKPILLTGIIAMTTGMTGCQSGSSDNQPDPVTKADQGSLTDHSDDNNTGPVDTGDNTSPDNTAPDNTAPDNTAPDDTALDNTAPDNTAPDDTAPDNTAPDDTAPDDTAPDSDGTNPSNPEPDNSGSITHADIDPSTPEQSLQGNWKLVWSDEFNTAGIDLNKWEHEVNGTGGGNNELQYYTDRTENSYIENGNLVLKAKKESYTGNDGTRQYTSSRLRTMNKGDFLYGRMEIKAKVPAGQGLWPAIWMLPTDWVYGGWAASGEIDIMEAVNLNGTGGNKVYGTLHYGEKWPGNVHSGDNITPATSVADNFHVYTVEWEEHEIRWYLDSELYQTQTDWWSSAAPYPAPFNQKFHLILNVAVGGTWPGNNIDDSVFPQSMEVDYVRVYQQNNDNVDADISRDAFAQIEAESADDIHGALTDTVSGRDITNYFNEGDFLRFNKVNFSQAANSVSLVVAAGNSNSKMQMRLDSIDGPVIANMDIAHTGSWSTYEEQTFNLLESVTGEHDIYILAKHPDGAGDLDYIRFANAALPIQNEVSIDVPFNVMSLNVYGYATMPVAADEYAAIVNAQEVDLLGIQEGVQDWMIQGLPTDYTRAQQLQNALGNCWNRRYQIFINTCRGNSFDDNGRFDLSDGPNVARTGEWAQIKKENQSVQFINVHWDHQSANTRIANAQETEIQVNSTDMATVVLGDFNTSCSSGEVQGLSQQTQLSTLVNAGIDCILVRGMTGEGKSINASPSDHPGVVASLYLIP
jgi:beta-glucanase (GH16 family)